MLTNTDILRHVDHTLLKADASWQEIQVLCGQALRFKTASVCIPPSYVKPVSGEYGSLPVICTVIGFPLGYSSPGAKMLETEQALKDGALEIDAVINIGDVKNSDYDRVLKEIRMIKGICGTNILKVIVETCYLSQEEKIRLCGLVNEAGADYIKTSTGFGPSGATVADVLLFKNHIGAGVKIKAAGGIKTREDMEALLNAGADRLGSSSAVKILCGENAAAGY
ncbi:MAG: deoxyribose-phosphate aldolase [Treponema sp.]|nr:deoxyribose-phosphate aldolase [Treponema sp.]